MDTVAFNRVRALIHEMAGISLGPAKRAMVANRLTRRLRETGHASFDAYLDAVEAGDSDERVHFANALTTNHTAFFREGHHFPILIDHLRALPDAGRGATIWSAACSTGEEPYSIAMSIVEAGFKPKDVRIIASDLDTEALETARQGVYSLAAAKPVGEQRLHRFFLEGAGSRKGFAKVRPEIRDMVEFRHINLFDAAWPVEGPLAAIFCRNAMIYFSKPVQLGILQRFAPLIAGGGLMFAGHAENFQYLAGDFLRICGRTVYRTIE